MAQNEGYSWLVKLLKEYLGGEMDNECMVKVIRSTNRTAEAANFVRLYEAGGIADISIPETAAKQQAVEPIGVDILFDALERIKSIYDNREDMAGVIAKEALGNFNKLNQQQ